MRAKERLGIMLLFLYAFCFISCDKDDDSVENIAIMSVSPELVWMRDSRVQVMECSIEGDNEKLYIAPDQIEGFEYNKGYDYKLKVKVIPLENPSTDGPTVRYELREIIFQHKAPFKIQLTYAVDAELKSIIEDDLRNTSSHLVGSGYVFNEELSTWTLVDADYTPLLSGMYQRENGPQAELPASYKLLPPNEQIVTHVKWTFIFLSGSEQMIRQYSLAPPGQSLAFSLGDEKGFEWIGAYDITADELLAGTDTAKTESKTAQAEALILELLADGKRMPSAELEKAVNERGISSRTMRTAKSRIGDRLVTEKDGTAWVCYLRD